MCQRYFVTVRQCSDVTVWRSDSNNLTALSCNLLQSIFFFCTSVAAFFCSIVATISGNSVKDLSYNNGIVFSCNSVAARSYKRVTALSTTVWQFVRFCDCMPAHFCNIMAEFFSNTAADICFIYCNVWQYFFVTVTVFLVSSAAHLSRISVTMNSCNNASDYGKSATVLSSNSPDALSFKRMQLFPMITW